MLPCKAASVDVVVESLMVRLCIQCCGYELFIKLPACSCGRESEHTMASAGAPVRQAANVAHRGVGGLAGQTYGL